jgi:hypothetical protein
MLAGSLIGLVLGGVLAVYDWRLVFLVSVPVGVVGTVWSYWKLKESATIRSHQKMVLWGNITFGAGLTVLLIGITYGLVPYGSTPMGWGSPWVIAALITGIGLLIAFPFVEKRAKDPLFRLDLFKIRMFSMGNFAGFLGALARGGVMIMLVVLLQGIWLPLHASAMRYAVLGRHIYDSHVPWHRVNGPISGWLSDKHGARTLAQPQAWS